MWTKVRNETLIAPLFPPEVITNDANPIQPQESLFPEEEALIQKAVPKRRREFIAGRLCAREALTKLGIKNFPILMGKDRIPIWPSEIVGSITHTEGYCGIAIALKTDVESLGLDVECVEQVTKDVWKHFCTQQELLWINSFPENEQQKNAALIFSAKESLYKCQYSISKEWVGFHDVKISIKPNENEFEARFLIDVESCFERGVCLRGKYFFSNGYILTGITLNKTKA